MVDVKTAIPMVMGANIGTSMTSTLVSLTHMGDARQVNTTNKSLWEAQLHMDEL